MTVAMVNNPSDMRSAARACARHSVHGTQYSVARRGLTFLELAIVLAVLSVLATLVLPAVGNFLGESRSDVTRQSLTRLRDVIAQTYWQDRVQKTNGCWQSAVPQPNPSVSTGRLLFPQLAFLFWNPNTNPNVANPDTTPDFDPACRCGWRGPYLVANNGAIYLFNPATSAATGFTEQYGESGDPTVLDGWGNPIVIQNPGIDPNTGAQDVRLVSAGPDGVLTMSSTISTATYLATPSLAGDDVYVSFEVR